MVRQKNIKYRINYSHCSEITYHEGILLKNQKIIVTTTLHSEKACPSSPAWVMTFRNRQPSEPAIKYSVPQEPWTKFVADLFGLYGLDCVTTGLSLSVTILKIFQRVRILNTKRSVPIIANLMV